MANTSQTNGNGTPENEATRAGEAVGASVNRIGDTARTAGRRARDEIERSGQEIGDEASKGYQAVKQVASNYADRGEALLRDQVERAPMQSLAIAVGIGFLMALLIRR